MDAFELLKSDHQKVNELFKQCQSGGGNRQVVDQIKQELELHAHLEETIFYPACERYPELSKMIEHAYEEHAEVKDLLDQLGNTYKGGENAQLNTLMQNVEHHVREEEGKLFPLCQKVMNRAELDALGRQLEAAKRGTGELRKSLSNMGDY